MACAVNDNSGAERLDYRYLAAWKMKDKQMSDKLEAAAKAAGFLDYFEQVNLSGTPIPPPQLNGDMVVLE